MVRYDYIARFGYYCSESSEHNSEYNCFYIKDRYPELIDRMVTYARRAHEEKNSRNYAYTSDILKNYAGGSKGAKGAKGSKMT